MQTQETRTVLPQPFAGQGMPPAAQQPGTMARALAFARSLSGGTVVLTGLVLVLQAAMPAGRRPSDLIGGFHGAMTTAQLDAERDAQRQTAETMANGQTEPAANWQMEQQLAATQLQTQAQALQTQAAIANLADATCIGAGLVALFGDQASENLARDMRGACGVGDQVRQGINASLAQSVRQGSGVMQRATPEGGLAPVAVPPR